MGIVLCCILGSFLILLILSRTIWDFEDWGSSLLLSALGGFVGGLFISLILTACLSSLAPLGYSHSEDSMIVMNHGYRTDGQPTYTIRFEPDPIAGDTTYYIETSERFIAKSDDIKIVIDSAYYPHIEYDVYTIDSWWFDGPWEIEERTCRNFVLTANDKINFVEVLHESKIEN